MIIWFAASVPESSKGGVQRSMKIFSQYLESSGNQVRIIYAKERNKNNYLFFSFMLSFRLLLNMRNPPDWIIARSSDGFFCALLSKLLRLQTKVAVHNHGWEEKAYQIESSLPKRIINNRTSWKAHLIRFPLLKASLMLSDICINGTIEEAKWISVRYRWSLRKMRIIPNGVKVPEKPFWPLQDNVPLNFLIIGGFTWKKNLEYGLQLFFKVSEKKSAHLFLVGTGDISASNLSLINAFGDSVTIISNEAQEKMTHWYHTCPFLISTSRYEGGRAFSILEAQSEGCVVFGTRIPSTCELISNKINGILLSGTDPDQDCNRIISVCSDTGQTRVLGTNAWECAKRSSVERQGSRLLRVLADH